MGAKVLSLLRWVAWLEYDAHTERFGSTRQKRIDSTPCGPFEQRGVLPTDSTAFAGWCRSAGGGCGCPSDRLGFRSLIHGEAATVMQYGGFAENAWERQKEDEWMRRERSEHCVCPKWGSILWTQ
jgi:hypothetical protein